MNPFMNDFESKLRQTIESGATITIRIQGDSMDLTSTVVDDEMNAIVLGGAISSVLDQMMRIGGRYKTKRSKALKVWQLVKDSVESTFFENYPWRKG